MRIAAVLLLFTTIACIDYGAAGFFCGNACASNLDCAVGSKCISALTIGGKTGPPKFGTVAVRPWWLG